LTLSRPEFTDLLSSLHLHESSSSLLDFRAGDSDFAARGSRPDPLAPSYDLRVYGPIKAEEKTPDDPYYRLIRLTVQDHAHAELLLSKFIRDYTVSPTVITQPVTSGSTRSRPWLLKAVAGFCRFCMGAGAPSTFTFSIRRWT